MLRQDFFHRRQAGHLKHFFRRELDREGLFNGHDDIQVRNRIPLAELIGGHIFRHLRLRNPQRIRNDGDVVLLLRRAAERPELDEHDLKRVHVTFDLGFNTPRARKRRGGIIAVFNEIHRAIDEQLLAKCERFFR